MTQEAPTNPLRSPDQRRRAKYLLAAILLVLGAGAGAWLAQSPSNDRIWSPEQARLATIRFDGHTVHVESIRNFAYSAPAQYAPAYYDRDFDLDHITSAWFVLTQFSQRWRGLAHSFVSFGFADSQFLAISVEARREQGEGYDPLGGLLRKFELVYIVGDERDVIGQRAAFSDQPVYLYPIRAPPERIREVFVEMMQRAERLRVQPEFYNTLTNSCISNLVAHVNHIAPHEIPGGWKTILPGYADEVAHRLGLLDTDLDLTRARQRFRINEQAQRYLQDPAFSLRIREPVAGR